MRVPMPSTTTPTGTLWVETINSPVNPAERRPVTFVLPGGPGAAHGAYLGYRCLLAVTDLVFHDPRGCGQSHVADIAECTMDNYINDVEYIRQYLGIDKINVLGKSYGSMCALGYALRYPAVVDKLILAAGAPSYRFLKRAKENLLKLGTPQQIAITEKIWAGEIANKAELIEFFRLTNPLYSIKARTEGATVDPEFKSELFSHEVLNEGFKQTFWHFDFEPKLPELTTPTLVLAGRHDWINDVSEAALMAMKIPHSQLHIFEQASHAMEVDVGEEYFQRIADFISH